LKGNIAAMDAERWVILSEIAQNERRRSLGKNQSSPCRDGYLELSAASAGAICQKLVDWKVCDECRDGCQKLGVLRSKYGMVKSGNSCGRCMRICGGMDTEMSSCIFSGSQRGQFGTLGKPCFRAVRWREAVGVQDFITDYV